MRLIKIYHPPPYGIAKTIAKPCFMGIADNKINSLKNFFNKR